MRTTLRRLLPLAAAAGFLLAASTPASASSHMDAPLITLDDAANTTDVYAFVQEENGRKVLVTALGVYPFEEPGIGPNKFNFDDDVLYEIHVATGRDVAAGRATFSYQFKFDTKFKNQKTILQSYLGVIENVDDAAQNLTQFYTVTKVNHRTGSEDVLGKGVVPPNNQGNATPFYNKDDNGENPARDGVATEAELDRYTRQSIATLDGGYVAFAGQRDDGFYADIQSIFDLLKLRNPGKDSQGGFNLHLMALAIPMDEIGGDQQIAGVYATTSRRRFRILADGDKKKPSATKRRSLSVTGSRSRGRGTRCSPKASSPSKTRTCTAEPTPRSIASCSGSTPNDQSWPCVSTSSYSSLTFRASRLAVRTSRESYIPDLIKVDLSTGPARLAGGGKDHPTNPDDPGFSPLSIFGGDTLVSRIQPGFGKGVVPGGWPNGRRFGDDVLDIAVTAIISDLRVSPPILRGPAGDNVNRNDMAFNKVFPYESTPQNGRNHRHP